MNADVKTGVQPQPRECAMRVVREERFFLPISLGNLFYSRRRLRCIFRRFRFNQAAAFIVICDTNRYLAYRGRGYARGEALAKARSESTELSTMIQKEVRRVEGPTLLRCMSSFVSDPEFIALGKRLTRGARFDAQARSYLEEFVNETATEFYGKSTPLARLWQQRYVLWETALSLHLTEKKDFTTELYKNDRGMFVNLLYTHCQPLLMRVLGERELHRRFVALEGLV